jgi:hypothetical protein
MVLSCLPPMHRRPLRTEQMTTNHHDNQPLPLETPNQQQLQPLNNDELSHVLAVSDKIEAKFTDNEKADAKATVRRPEYTYVVVFPSL